MKNALSIFLAIAALIGMACDDQGPAQPDLLQVMQGTFKGKIIKFIWGTDTLIPRDMFVTLDLLAADSFTNAVRDSSGALLFDNSGTWSVTQSTVTTIASRCNSLGQPVPSAQQDLCTQPAAIERITNDSLAIPFSSVAGTCVMMGFDLSVLDTSALLRMMAQAYKIPMKRSAP